MKKILLLTVTFFCFLNLINAQAGQLDSSFGNNGVVKTDLGDSYRHGSPGAKQILSLPDGSFYIIQKNSFGKRRANGSIDSSFGINGFVADYVDPYGQQADPYKMAIEPDGKIVVASYYRGLVRYNTDGSLDSSFSENGNQINDYYYYALAIDKDGKIIVAGSDYISRYNIDGSADTTFSGDGKVTPNSDTNYNTVYIYSAVTQSDGKIVVAGYYLRNGDYEHTDFAVLRYNINGSLDSSFSGDGIQITDFGSRDAALAAAIQSDGKIVVTGFSLNKGADFALARYNIDGSLDKSFSGDGKLTANLFYSSSIASEPDGKILLLSGGTLIRYNTDGSRDHTIFKNDNFEISSIAVQSDGKILSGGGAGNSNLALARYNTDGSFDNTFNRNGILTDIARAENTGYRKTAVQKDGKIVAAGSYWNEKDFDLAIARYNTDGSADNTFSGDGIQTTDSTSHNDYAKTVAIQKDGKIVVASVNAIARYNTDGSLDKTFSGDGKVTADSIDINSVAIQSDGKIVVAGGQRQNIYNVDTYPAVARYNPDGSVDKTFGADGKQIVALRGFFDYFDGIASSIVIQNDQKIVIGGSFNYTYFGDRGEVDRFDSVGLVRFNINGSLDTTYSHTGKKIFTGSNTTSYGYAGSSVITKQDDDKIVVAGIVGYKFITGRVNIDGSTDTSFKGINYAIQEPVDTITSIALQGDGKIVVTRDDTLYRFTADGRFDSTFDNDGKQISPYFIKDMVIANNKLYTAGGNRYGTIARYLLDNNNTPPTVTLTTPANNTTRLAPAAHIKLSAAATDKDGTITKVEFYNGTTFLHTETVFPYGYVWEHVPLGNYTLTAKAYDNSGNVTTSAPVHISVVPNKPPVVSITKPVNNRSFAAPGYIHLEAAASDTDGRVTNVKFYNGSSLLRTEYEYPYTYHWENVPRGTYTITAVATDNWGAQTTSAPVTIRVKASNAMIVSNRPVNNQKVINDEISLKLSPNPATDIVNINTNGLQQNKQATISVISVSGNVLTKVQTSSSSQTQLDVSSLASGVYTIKIVSGDKVMFKQFVKL